MTLDRINTRGDDIGWKKEMSKGKVRFSGEEEQKSLKTGKNRHRMKEIETKLLGIINKVKG